MNNQERIYVLASMIDHDKIDAGIMSELTWFEQRVTMSEWWMLVGFAPIGVRGT